MTTETRAAASGPAPTSSIDQGYAYFEGRIVPLAEANVSIATHALNYGTGCFEGIRGYWNEEQGQLYVLKLREHYQRMLRSTRVLKIKLEQSADELCAVTLEMLRRNAFRSDVYIRPLAFKSGRMIKVALTNIPDSFAVFAVPMGDYIDTTRGLRVTISGWRRVEDNAIPARAKVTGAYVNMALAVDDALAAGYDETIMLTNDGHVAEGSSSNLFMVADRTLVTSPVSEDILVGITRAAIAELARDLGLPLVERRIDRSELYMADELFYCGTGVQVAHIGEIDGRPIGLNGQRGPVVEQLQARYLAACRGRIAEYAHWRTPVYG
ncbi:MAG TPA: branched-chain amino acid transaminase [Chloroflexota bacterium]|nr:branched-chain amino acid transaminase [Chloroflexota bacterium]